MKRKAKPEGLSPLGEAPKAKPEEQSHQGSRVKGREEKGPLWGKAQDEIEKGQDKNGWVKKSQDDRRQKDKQMKRQKDKQPDR